MPADDAHHEDSLDTFGARTAGPRHAAPKKPLFNRLHMPAGKAMAIAAMPTAVLMGMGLTPTLASAKSMPKNPFQDGPCVTAPDEAGKSADDADESAKPTDKSTDESTDTSTAKPADGGSGADAQGDDGGAEASPSPAPSDAPRKAPSAATDSAPEASATPSPAESEKPSGDLLGLGEALGNLLGGGTSASDSAPAPSATPSPSATATGDAKAADGPDGQDKGVLGGVTDAVGDTVDKVTGTAKDTVGKAEDALKNGADPSPSPSASASAAPGEEDADGKIPFPCVEEKKVAGKDDTPPAPIPDQPWQLVASSLTLYDLHYKGVANVTMPNHQTKQALKFTASGVDIGDLHQIVLDRYGNRYHVQAAAGSTSTIRDGEVTMYTERLEGNLFGLVPVVFDPEHPPPPIDLPVPYYFTNVKIDQAGQFGGNLHIPGLHQYVTK